MDNIGNGGAGKIVEARLANNKNSKKINKHKKQGSESTNLITWRGK